MIQEMVRTLQTEPDLCIILHPNLMPTEGIPAVTVGDRKRMLHRHLLHLLTGEEVRGYLIRDCHEQRCLNPYHFKQSSSSGGGPKKQCPNGHVYTKQTTLKTHSTYKCRICNDANNAKRRKGEHGRGYCKNGHKMTKQNTYATPYKDTVQTRCRTCKKADALRRYHERKGNND